ncbi:MAG: hypothetical protein HOK06_04395 [Rhodospirillaceae bacterium]|jgi:hypothetical protein|nr:hypothetical protein [Rhodospirillaceae bacterium]
MASIFISPDKKSRVTKEYAPRYYNKHARAVDSAEPLEIQAGTNDMTIPEQTQTRRNSPVIQAASTIALKI